MWIVRLKNLLHRGLVVQPQWIALVQHIALDEATLGALDGADIGFAVLLGADGQCGRQIRPQNQATFLANRPFQLGLPGEFTTINKFAYAFGRVLVVRVYSHSKNRFPGYGLTLPAQMACDYVVLAAHQLRRLIQEIHSLECVAPRAGFLWLCCHAGDWRSSRSAAICTVNTASDRFMFDLRRSATFTNASPLATTCVRVCEMSFGVGHVRCCCERCYSIWRFVAIREPSTHSHTHTYERRARVRYERNACEMGASLGSCGMQFLPVFGRILLHRLAWFTAGLSIC